MNKYKTLSKALTKKAAITLAVVAAVGAVYAGVSFYAGGAAKQKSDAETKFNQEQGLLNNLKNQIDQSGEAEKRYAALMEARTNDDFSANRDVLADWLRNAVSKFRLTDVKLTPASEVASTKPELANFSQAVSLRQGMKIEFKAISDLHVFSFIDAWTRAAPGLLRIELLKLKRNGDMRIDALNTIRHGGTPLLVEAEIQFTWIGLTPKTDKTNAAAPTPQGN